MKVNNKLIKKFINNICVDINKMRKHKNGDIIKNINMLLGKKCLQSPFVLDSIKTDKNTNPNECFGVAIIPSYNNIKMISSKIRNQDDIDNITTALFKTSKIKFDIILDRRIFELKAPFIFTDDEITVMIFHQILNLFDETFKNQIILNYENLLKYENGYGGINSLVYSTFCNTHSKIYEKPVNGDIFNIDKQVVILGYHKQLVGALSKMDSIYLNNTLDNSIISNFVNKVGIGLSNNTGRIELINKFNKNNKITSVDLSVVNYFNEEESNMDNDNKYELSFLHEAYFGKSKNISQMELILNDCVEYAKKHNSSFVSNTIDMKCSKYINKQFVKLEDLVINEFGFSTASIRLNHALPSVNAFTYVTFELFNMHKMKVKSTKDGVKYIDGSAFVCEIGDQIFTGNYTGAEILGILLHEIGHQFYRNNNKEYTRMMLINEILITISSWGIPITTLSQINNEMNAMRLRDNPNVRKVSDTLRKIDGTFAKLVGKLALLLNTLNITSIFEIIGSIFVMIGNWLGSSKHGKYNEKFADNFASSYGYGKELSSALYKMSMEKQTGDNIPVVTYLKDLTSFIPNMMMMMYDVHPPTYSRIFSQYKYLEKELNSSKMDTKTKESLRKQLLDIKKMLDNYPEELVENQKLRGKFFTAWAYSVTDVKSSKLYTDTEFSEKLEWDQLKSTNESTELLFEEVSPMIQHRVDKLEEVVGNVKIAYLNGEKSEIRKNEKYLSDTINDICKYFNKKITINDCSICTDNGNNEDDMFGARAVFTSMENISKYLKYTITMENMDKVLTSSFEHADFNLEIDHNILENNQYNFSNREIMSIILHELGHMLDINVYSRVAMAYQSAIINLANIKSLKNSSNTRALCALYLISNIEADRLFSRDRKSITVEEIRADSFVGNLGLSNDLNSAIDKFYKINKHNFFKSKNFKEMVSDAENFVQASMTYHNRKRKINRLILTEKIKQTSKSIKSLLSNISKDVLKNGDDKISDGNVYIKDDDIGGIVNESFDFIKKFKKSPNKISSYDIDTLRIQSDMIEDINDKQIMLYKIFKRKNQISELLSDEEFKKENKDYSILLQSYMNTLNDLYNKVMNVKITNQIQKYGVFIKYPKGYEG